jgi:hypothetical protein
VCIIIFLLLARHEGRHKRRNLEMSIEEGSHERTIGEGTNADTTIAQLSSSDPG